MKLIQKLLPLICVLMMCGCTKGAEPIEAAPPSAAAETAPTPTPTPEPERLTFPALTDDESLMMANHMSVDRAAVYDNVLYAFDFDADYSPVLARFVITENGLTERTELVKNCVPEYLTVYDGRLYFVNSGAIQTASLDGKNCKTLVENVSGDMMIADGMLWYRDGEGRFCRAGLDGKNSERIIDRLCFYPYVTGDCVVYQDDADGETLHIYSLAEKREQRLTDIPAYEYVIIGDALFFTARTENGLCPARLGIDGTLEVFSCFVTESPVTYSFLGGEWTASGVPLDKLSTSAPGQSTADGYETAELTSRELEVRARCNPDGRIREFVLYTADGEWVFIGPGSEIR